MSNPNDCHEPPAPVSLKNAPKDLAKPPLTGCFSASDWFSTQKTAIRMFEAKHIIIRPCRPIGQTKPLSRPEAWKLNGWRGARKTGRAKSSPRALRKLKPIGPHTGPRGHRIEECPPGSGTEGRFRWKEQLHGPAAVAEGMKIIRAASIAAPVISKGEKPGPFSMIEPSDQVCLEIVE